VALKVKEDLGLAMPDECAQRAKAMPPVLLHIRIINLFQFLHEPNSFNRNIGLSSLTTGMVFYP
jgi:hypothetical protein